MNSNVLIDADSSNRRWIEIALQYLPKDVCQGAGTNLAMVALGSIGACRLPDQYRKGELVFTSDWMFPPVGHSEADDAGRFFILTVLHEIAHAVRRHKSPLLDGLSPEESWAQEDEADHTALDWFNRHVEQQGNVCLKAVERDEFRRSVDRFARLYYEFEGCKAQWHANNAAS